MIIRELTGALKVSKLRKCPYCGKSNRMDSETAYFDEVKNRLFCTELEREHHAARGSLQAQERRANKFIADKRSGKRPPKKKRTQAELMKDESFWHAKVANECHSYVKERDVDEACISCQQLTAYQWDAGHFKSQAGFPAMKYNTFNIYKQCRRCNARAGNINGGKVFRKGYVSGLISRHGTARLLYLEAEHKLKRYSTAELKRLFEFFKYRRKQLRGKL